MKRYILIIALILACITVTHAQRMLSGTKGLQINVGSLSLKEPRKNYGLGIMLTGNRKNGSYFICGAEYTHRLANYRSMEIPLETYTGEVGYSVQLLTDSRRIIAINTSLTALAGYETVNKGKSLLSDGAMLLDQNHFIYGASARLSLETYLSDRFVIVLQGSGRLIWGTDLNRFRSLAGIGLRFNF